MEKDWHLWIDTGGTFTDCLARSPQGVLGRFKVLSSGCLRATLDGGPDTCRLRPTWDDFDGFLTGARLRPLEHPSVSYRILEHGAGSITLDRPLPEAADRLPIEIDFDAEAPVVAARLATRTAPGNPLPPLRMRLATTRATNALLEGKGDQVALFVTRGFGDLLRIGTQQRPDLFALDIRRPQPLFTEVVEVEERLHPDGGIHVSLDLAALEEKAGQLRNRGIGSAAIALLHSWRNPDHERALRDFLIGKGMRHVSISHDLGSGIGILPRAETAVINAALAPMMERYLESIRAGLDSPELQMMTSAGGLVPDHAFCPKDILLSGPAGGVVGAAASGREAGTDRIITFDMGGTSTDVSRYPGHFDHRFRHRVGPATLMAPALHIETVAAGGGSICGHGPEGLTVGPESAGASPGPACYGLGGPLTLTDVNLLLGRMDPDRFGIPVDIEAARKALVRLRRSSPAAERTGDEALLQGFLQIANERMAHAIGRISVREGYDPADYALVAFGGAGGQHACAIAGTLGIERILLPGNAGLQSAHGLRYAHLERFHQLPLLRPLEEVELQLPSLVREATGRAVEELIRLGVPKERARTGRRILHLRLQGQESSEEIEYREGMDVAEAFRQRYRAVFGYWPEGRKVELLSLHASARSRDLAPAAGRPHAVSRETDRGAEGDLAPPVGGGCIPVHHRPGIGEGERIPGPAIVQDGHATVFVDPGWIAVGQPDSSLILELRSRPRETTRDPLVREEILAHRFGHLVGDMGAQLERTSVSTNVKDRKDFSCALLDPEGDLLANAPHIPVHLGAMGHCVRSVIGHMELAPGDMVVTNHPGHGGSHLPDITVISPVHDRKSTLIGHVANRAHHAELGGIQPGSMPPGARHLEEEGVVIPPTRLFRKGEARWQDIEKLLTGAPHPTRNLQDNLADLRAQAAANLRGAANLQRLAEETGTPALTAIMGRLKDRAAEAIARSLAQRPPLRCTLTETLDDGTPIVISLRLRDRRLTLDFAGTAPRHPASFNATPAIVRSAVLYVLRLLVDRPLPLNEGLLAGVDIRLPRCFLNPEFPADPGNCPAVVAGNVETSQRIADALVRALGLAAGSQGTMNNLVFGNRHTSYYETVGGGAGAGPGFRGADAIHTHMTNTGITDPEILESRYPVLLRRFAIRRGSGGRGAFPGGNGVIRHLEFTRGVELSILSQHRTDPPAGLRGGEPGRTGNQYILHRDGRCTPLSSTAGVTLEAGDAIVMETPGGGGWGRP